MRVLVTGASGHVGGAVARHLDAVGMEVVGVGRHPGPVPGVYGRVDGNLADTQAAWRIAGLTEPCDAIVHAGAAIDHDPHAVSVSLTNCLGTQQVLELADLWGARRFVYVSGVPVIGVPLRLPVTEDHETRPRTAYHASKLYGEHLTALTADRGLSAVTLRLTSPVGPGTPAGRIVSVFAAQARAGEPLELLGQGGRRQDFVDVRDVASATEAALGCTHSGVLNIASGRATSNRELAQLCVDTLGSTSPIRLTGRPDPEEDVVWDVSIERARTALGYAPQLSLADSITALAEPG